MTKPKPVDQITWLIQRRDMAIAEYEKSKANGDAGHQIYWHTISVDAGLLLGWIADDQYWTMQAKADANGLKKEVEALDNPSYAKTIAA